MQSLLIFGAIVLLPVILAFVLGVNSVILFLSVAVGLLLQQSLADSFSLVLSAFVKGSSDMVANLVLLCAPLVLTLIFLRRSAKQSALVLQVAPLVLTGATFGYLVLGHMSSTFQADVYASQIGPSIKQASDVVIASAAVLNLLLAWRLYRGHHEDKHHKKHH